MKKLNLKLFWKITSQWYFFPVFYLVLSSMVFIYIKGYNDVEPSKIFWLTLFLIPNGLFYFIYLLTNKKPEVILGNFLPLFYFPFVTILIITISFFKSVKGIVLKWCIIGLFVLIFLTFFGCAAGHWEKATYFENAQLFG